MTSNHLRITCVALGLALSIVAGKAEYTVPLNGLIGYWPGNGHPLDLSPTLNDGTFIGTYAPGGPVGGGAFDLSTAKVYIPAVTNYNFHLYDGWSVAFWFTENGGGLNADNGMFLGQDNGPGPKPKWFIDYAYSVYGDNAFYNFHVNDFNGETIFVGSQAEPPTPGWTHLAVTIDNVDNSTVSFYLNGQPIGTAAMGPYVLETSANLIFGQEEAYSFNGLISEVVIYNRVISFDEVSQLANASPVTPFRITSETPDGNGNVVLTWRSIPGATYQVVGTTNLPPQITWTNAGRPVLATGTNASATIPITSSATFFKVRSP